MTRFLKHSRFLAGALALVVGLTLAGPPAFALEPTNAVSPRPIATAASAKVGAVPAEVLAQATPAAQPPAAAPAGTGGKPFFKTTKGAIALGLIAGALGYMGYSMSHDRIKSPAK